MSTNDKNVEATARKDTGAMPELELIAAEEREDRRALRVAMGIAVALHAVLLVTQFPALTNADPLPPPEEDEPFVIQEMRIKPPPPPPPEEEPPPPEPQVERPEPKPEVRKVPIPDPTPDEPEPPPPMEEPPPREPEIVEPVTPRVVERAPVALPSTDALVSIPDPPPAPPAPPPPPAPEPEPQGPIMVGGDVRAPEKISGADPQYPEVARQARVEGVVIVKAVIDKRGRVQNVEIVKDLSMGLGKSAAAAVRNWRFRPATLHGKPVDVYYNLTVHFSVN